LEKTSLRPQARERVAQRVFVHHHVGELGKLCVAARKARGFVPWWRIRPFSVVP
jgi:hypothetical protein